jgi:hypothetical protein
MSFVRGFLASEKKGSWAGKSHALGMREAKQKGGNSNSRFNFDFVFPTVTPREAK